MHFGKNIRKSREKEHSKYNQIGSSIFESVRINIKQNLVENKYEMKTEFFVKCNYNFYSSCVMYFNLVLQIKAFYQFSNSLIDSDWF